MSLFTDTVLFFDSKRIVVPAAVPETPNVQEPVLRLQAPVATSQDSLLHIECVIYSDLAPSATITIYAKATWPDGSFVTLQTVLSKANTTATLIYDAPRGQTDQSVILEILDASDYIVGVPFSQSVTVPAVVVEEPLPQDEQVKTFVQDWPTIQNAKTKIAANHPAYVAAKNALLNEANEHSMLTKTPVTLGGNPVQVRDYRWNGTDGYTALNNGDGTPKMVTWPYAPLTLEEANRTYYSLRTYQGPNGTNSILNGIPFTGTGRSGKTFPVVNEMKSPGKLRTVNDELRILGLLYHFFDGATKEQAGAKLVAVMRAFFTSPTTGMHPHLLFGQVSLGNNDNYGAETGFVDMEAFCFALDGIALTRDYAGFTDADKTAINNWVDAMRKWSTKRYSPVPSKTTAPRGFHHHRIVGIILSTNNNIRIMYECMILTMHLFLGEVEEARNRINNHSASLLTNFSMTSAMPGMATRDVRRSKSWTYAIKNINGWIRYATIADQLGIDIWNRAGENGATLKIAMRWMAYHAITPSAWAAVADDQHDNQSTELIYYFRTAARAATLKYAGDSELMGWVNSYFALLEAKTGISSHYKETGFRTGQDYSLLYQLYGKAL